MKYIILGIVFNCSSDNPWHFCCTFLSLSVAIKESTKYYVYATTLDFFQLGDSGNCLLWSAR